MANNQSVRRHLHALPGGRIIGKLKEGRSMTREQLSGGQIVVVVYEEPHLADDRYIVLQARRNRRQTAEKSLDTRHRRLGDRYIRGHIYHIYRGQKTARWWSVCTTPCTVYLTPAHRRRRSLRCREHRNWRDNEWGRVLFTDESRFSLSSDSHLREREAAIIPRTSLKGDRCGGRGVLVWRCIMLGSRT
ncbi:transposable element Tcb1 transposase [Trichonephila clavipes]|nr:transposable element Tcb1 transposase [Trichonephila clavipes]